MELAHAARACSDQAHALAQQPEQRQVSAQPGNASAGQRACNNLMMTSAAWYLSMAACTHEGGHQGVRVHRDTHAAHGSAHLLAWRGC